jgi:hypothetical protein
MAAPWPTIAAAQVIGSAWLAGDGPAGDGPAGGTALPRGSAESSGTRRERRANAASSPVRRGCASVLRFLITPTA